MNQELATVRLFRFDPVVESNPRYHVYKVPYKGLSVLGLLQFIRESCDGSLAFRYGCEGRQTCRCGSCMVLVNGKPCLSCERTAEKEMTIEPYPKFKVIKDLAIDFNELV